MYQLGLIRDPDGKNYEANNFIWYQERTQITVYVWVISIKDFELIYCTWSELNDINRNIFWLVSDQYHKVSKL